MMNRAALLGQCRLALAALRAQEKVVESLREHPLPHNAVIWKLREDKAQQALEAAQTHYNTLYPVALAALDGLEGREYDVCWRFYLLGQTVAEIAYYRGEAHRTISRAKAEGLKRLEENT